jgi:hypothetical protein
MLAYPRIIPLKPNIAMLNKQKCHLFFLLQNWRTRMEQVQSREVGDTSGRGKEVGKLCGRVNILHILCVHIYVSGKMIPVETIPRMEKEEG